MSNKPISRPIYSLFILLLFNCTLASEVEKSWEVVDYENVRGVTINSTVENPNPPGSVVAQHGQLRLEGNQLVDQQGDPIQLKGMSAFWVNWAADFANEDVIAHLAQDWNTSVYRVAIAVEEDGGYVEDPQGMIDIATRTIDACIEQGIYVIVDWHAHDTLPYAQQESEFFRGIAETYGDYPNIIYEIWNEPVDQNWTHQVKPYCEAIINNVIRPLDDNIIIVGNPHWAQDFNLCARRPIQGENILYAIHFYAGSHSWLRDRADEVLQDGNIALFASEWGTSMANGDDGVFTEESDRWIQWMEENNISWCNWSITSKNESSAALLPGASTGGYWSDSELSESGLYIKGKF